MPHLLKYTVKVLILLVLFDSLKLLKFTFKATFYIINAWNLQLSKCKCGLKESACNSKQKWNHDKCRREYKEIDDWSCCKDDYTWNPSAYVS